MFMLSLSAAEVKVGARVHLYIYCVPVMGVHNPNNQYNIYWIKYNRLSKKLLFPRLILRLNLLHCSLCKST